MDPISAHLSTIRALGQVGGPLDADGPAASTANPHWFVTPPGGGRPAPTAARLALHDRLIAARLAGHRPAHHRRLVVVTGPPGAGKSTVRAAIQARAPQPLLAVDADDFKADLLSAAQQDGSLAAWFTTDAIQARQADGEVFSPLDFAPLVHRESALLARRLRDEAISEGHAVVLDTVLVQAHSLRAFSRKLVRAGYEVDLLDIEVGEATSRRQVEGRWRQAYADHLAGRDVAGGRWVPSRYAADIFVSGRARTWQAADDLADLCPMVMRMRRYQADGPGGLHTPILDLTRARPGGPLRPAGPPLPGTIPQPPGPGRTPPATPAR